jgi:HPt (histidine-containing phosphotransfer) domain-containing protein
MSVIDAAALDRLVSDLGGDRASVRELVDSFLVEAPETLAEGRAAVAAKDAATAQRAYHTLKGNAATFGATELFEHCKKIEQAARGGALPNAGDVAKADSLFGAAKAELANWK